MDRNTSKVDKIFNLLSDAGKTVRPAAGIAKTKLQLRRIYLDVNKIVFVTSRGLC